MARKPVPYGTFARIFGRDKDGRAILEELNRVFYNQASYTSNGDALNMAFREGQRSVVALLNHKTKEAD